MHGDFFLIEQPDARVQRAARLPFGDTRGRNEAWLRDLLFHSPDVLPIADLDSAFGPLRPLCRELRTEAGPLDLAYINAAGRLTLVECKLWRNPEARRKVVAQVLDYARAIARWSYADLQRQVCAATGRKGNVPFEIAREGTPNLEEARFIDAVTRGMRAGRFLLLIAGDGIREDVGAMAEMVNRNAALGFSFGLVEVALYALDSQDGALAVQPRVVARTQTIERTVVLLQGAASNAYLGSACETDEAPSPPGPRAVEDRGETGSAGEPDVDAQNPRRAEYRRWWQPVLDMRFDDPEQEPPRLFYPNNVRASLPPPGLAVTAYRMKGECGVFLSGRAGALDAAWDAIAPHRDAVVAALPEGTRVEGDATGPQTIGTRSPRTRFADEDAERRWLSETLNAYVNALRPLLKR